MSDEQPGGIGLPGQTNLTRLRTSSCTPHAPKTLTHRRMEYYSCEWIEERLCLLISHLQWCGIQHSCGAKGLVQICEFDGGKLPIDEINRSRRELTERNNERDADSPCKGCFFLKKRKWEQPKGNARFREIWLDSYSICNLACEYCYTIKDERWELRKNGYELLPILQDMLKEGRFKKDARLVWGGGEPTVKSDFRAIAQTMLDHGFHQQIFTNAVCFADVIEEGLAQGKMSVTTSIDAGTRETYARIRGKDLLDVVWKNLARYARTGGYVIAKYIIRDGNSHPTDIREFVRMARRSGIRWICLSPDGEEVAQDSMSEETLFAFGLLLHEAKKQGIEHCWIGHDIVNSETMARLSTYVPLEKRRWRYRRFKAKRLLSEVARKVQRTGRLLRAAPATWRAIARAEACIRDPRSAPLTTVRELLDHQTRYPDRRLASRLADIGTMHDIPEQRVQGRVTMLDLTDDSFTHDCLPCFILLDNRSSQEPLHQKLWIACHVPAWASLPIAVTVEDGASADFTHTFHQADRIQRTLPPVPPGQVGIFAVRTDRCWTPSTVVPESQDPRSLGVRLSIEQ
jgi:hypothetical protein